MRIGIDAGGTFTDFVVLRDDGSLETFKLRSNPQDPASVILEGISRVASDVTTAEVVHGSTVATNALLERKGARTAFVTTEGFEDLLAIGRQNRRELYNLTPVPPVPLVPTAWCFGVKERVYADRTIHLIPNERALQDLRDRLRASGVVSVAICFLHAYATPANERLVAATLCDEFHISASSDICPEFREYERSSTTVINAYVGPLMDAYLGELERRCPYPISILQSNGGFMSASDACRHAVRTILSGPAGGAVAMAEIARASGLPRVLGFDMGGTSTDVSLCDGHVEETTEAYIDGFPVRVPMLDIHTVGAGGGSLARVDGGGLLRVGPESAGGDPGPACYGKGDRPTVTDAQVVLGRIAAEQFLGGTMEIAPERSDAAIDGIAARLGLPRIDAAAGIVRVANANMERAIRAVSIERGHDPRDFALLAFGGGGGLHACEIAENLGMRTVIVPQHAGVLSALGMLLADRVRDAAAGVLGRDDHETVFAELEASVGHGGEIARFADVRYAGQSYEITVPWDTDTVERFHAAHEKLYGYRNEKKRIEVVTLRVRSRTATARPQIEASPQSSTAPVSRRVHVSGGWVQLDVYDRASVGDGPYTGPALVLDYGATTLIPPGWTFRADRAGSLIVSR